MRQGVTVSRILSAEVPALNLSVPLFSATNTDLKILDDEGSILDIDQGLRLEVTKTGGACRVDWSINYEEIV